jgi:hypothetical protein
MDMEIHEVPGKLERAFLRPVRARLRKIVHVRKFLGEKIKV